MVGDIFDCPQSPTGQALIVHIASFNIGDFGCEETDATHADMWWCI